MERDASKTNKAIIVGASSGIGRALAKVLANNGFVVGLTARRTELLKSLQAEISTLSYIREMDLRNPEDAVKAVEDLIQTMGGVDLIVLNAGVDVPDPELDWKIENEILKVNVTGFLAMMSAAIKHFTNRGAGHIVGISSIAGLRGNGRSPGYSASKAYMSNFLEGLRQRVNGKNIWVTDIRPGFVDTPMIQGKNYPFWVAPVEKAAEQIFQAIRAKKRVAYVTKRWVLIAMIYKILPGWFYDAGFRKIVTEVRQKN